MAYAKMKVLNLGGQHKENDKIGHVFCCDQ